MTDRLKVALDLLGYGKAKKIHYRGNLVNAIMLFAGLQRDVELAAACKREFDLILAEGKQCDDQSTLKIRRAGKRS